MHDGPAVGVPKRWPIVLRIRCGPQATGPVIGVLAADFNAGCRLAVSAGNTEVVTSESE